MDLDFVFFSFLQGIAVGTAMVIALLLATWLGIPQRTEIAADHRTLK